MDRIPAPGAALCPGAVEFEREGQRYRLEPVQEDPDSGELFLIFKDRTSGLESYPPGRFLYADAPREGRVMLDFNRAYNPPRAFTPYATCPLPPPQNELPLAVRAGEKLLEADGTISVPRYTLPEAPRLVGAWRDPLKFADLKPADLAELHGCDVVITRAGEGRFEGSTQERPLPQFLQGCDVRDLAVGAHGRRNVELGSRLRCQRHSRVGPRRRRRSLPSRG